MAGFCDTFRFSHALDHWSVRITTRFNVSYSGFRSKWTQSPVELHLRPNVDCRSFAFLYF
jgi:hypothetical protein